MFYVIDIKLAFTNIFNKTTNMILKKEFENRKIISSLDKINDDIIVKPDNIRIKTDEDIKKPENKTSIIIHTYESIK